MKSKLKIKRSFDLEKFSKNVIFILSIYAAVHGINMRIQYICTIFSYFGNSSK